MARRRYKGPPETEAGEAVAPPISAKEAQKCRRWKRELRLADKREKDWRLESEKIVKRYRGEEKRRNRYNVLWSNTEILRPAIYNSKPNPDVRRRFRDADPVGKAVGEVLERSLYFMVDGDATDNAIKNDVLDALLPGRGVTRVLYVPKLSPVGATDPKPAPTSVTKSDATSKDSDDGGGSEPAEANEGDYEQVEYEQVVMAHVDWADFRHGFGRTWDEVEWVGFRHKLDREDAEKKLGKDVLASVTFAPEVVEDQKKYHEEAATITKVAEFWEIWDKLGERVFFLHDSVEQCLYPLDNPDGEPPLELEGFFPCPQPLMLFENTGSLMPVPTFRLYEDQADSLDVLSGRIDKITKGLRLRGVYDSKLVEIPDLLTGEDNQLTPVQNAQQWADAGGLEKAIAWMPVEQAAKVLECLYVAREKQKAIIDELTGIMDIVRGSTDPNETLGAQRLKSGFYSVRLWRMQNEVKRYARDLLRLAAQVMTSRFGADTFAAMTDLKFPTAAQKAQLQFQIQQAQVAAAQHAAMMQNAQAAPQPGAPPPQAGAAPPPPPPMAPPAPGPNPQLLQVPTWEDILALMHTPAMRQFRVDVETDSTISGTLESDMEGLSEVLKAIAEALTGFAPLVASGAMPADAAKEVVLTIIRRARMGTAVEDQFEKLQAPKPPQQPPDTRVQQAQAKGQADQAITAMQEHGKQQLEQMRQAGENQRLQFEEQQKTSREQAMEHMRTQREQLLEANKTQRDEMLAKFDSLVKIIVATINATKQPDIGAQSVADAAVRSVGPRDIDPASNLAPTSGAAQ